MTTPITALHRLVFDVPGEAALAGCAAVTSATAASDLEALGPAILHERERARLGGMAPRRQRSFLLGRAAAKAAFGVLSDVAPVEIEVANGLFDQPLLRTPRGETIGLTLSHTADHAFALVHDSRLVVGVDIEDVSAANLGAYLTAVTSDDLLSTGQLSNELTRAAVVWTAKEALGKALRCGLTVPFEILAIKQIDPVAPGAFRMTFRNFPQYAGVSVVDATLAASLVYPKACHSAPLLSAMTALLRSLPGTLRPARHLAIR